jgi:excisionase family DNA binding protein
MAAIPTVSAASASLDNRDAADLDEIVRRLRSTASLPPASLAAAMLDVQDVAGLLKCSRRHVYRMADAGRMPAPIKLGALVRWDRDVLIRWIADGCPPVRRAGRPAR